MAVNAAKAAVQPFEDEGDPSTPLVPGGLGLSQGMPKTADDRNVGSGLGKHSGRFLVETEIPDAMPDLPPLTALQFHQSTHTAGEGAEGHDMIGEQGPCRLIVTAIDQELPLVQPLENVLPRDTQNPPLSILLSSAWR